MPAYVAYWHRGVAVYLFGSRRLDIELGRHDRYLTSAAPPMRSLISWRGTSERCTRTRLTEATPPPGACLTVGGDAWAMDEHD
jgi:hypothetical protein